MVRPRKIGELARALDQNSQRPLRSRGYRSHFHAGFCIPMLWPHAVRKGDAACDATMKGDMSKWFGCPG